MTTKITAIFAATICAAAMMYSPKAEASDFSIGFSFGNSRPYRYERPQYERYYAPRYVVRYEDRGRNHYYHHAPVVRRPVYVDRSRGYSYPSGYSDGRSSYNRNSYYRR
jgi:hypothetical protein